MTVSRSYEDELVERGADLCRCGHVRSDHEWLYKILVSTGACTVGRREVEALEAVARESLGLKKKKPCSCTLFLT